MPRRTPRVPKYRHYKPKDLAVIRLDGHDVYLGKYDSPESREKYRRVVAEWLARQPVLPDASKPRAVLSPELSINDLILAFWTRHAEKHYRRPDGTPTGELDNYRDSLRPLRRLYGRSPAGDFSPLGLKAVRQDLIDAGLSRTTINQRVGRIVRLFKWAASEELVPAAVYHALKTVSGLPKGRSAAREPTPVRPVPDADVEAVRPHVARQVWAMIELQRLTGMRPGEVVAIRTRDLDTSDEVWAYTPDRHKTEHRGKQRTIFLGPLAQAVVRPWLRPDPSEYLFQPKEAMAEYRREQRRRRTTPLYPSVLARTPKANPKYRPGARYSPQTYCHAVQYGCARGGVASWSPNQLRHATATRIRERFSLEAAQVVLGHAKADVTQVYAERDLKKAREVMAAVG